MRTKNDTDNEKDLDFEAIRINYSLRSTFFYRKLEKLGYFGIIKDIEAIARHKKNYSWAEKKYWNITDNAWESIKKEKIDLLRVFAHPKIIVEHPKLIIYYRNVAAIPLKGVQYLAFNISGYEDGTKKEISYRQSLKLTKLFNSHISTIIESTLNISSEKIKALMYSSAGATIDGSWRNKIGEEAENMVKSYLIRLCIDKHLIDSMIDRSNSPIDFDQAVDYISNISEYRGTKLKNKKSILFSSEPDIRFIDESGKPIAVIEVKGGADPAGALERLGAIDKSFAQARKDNPGVTTILTITRTTRELRERSKEDKLIDLIFNLTSIIHDMDYRLKFLDEIEKIIGS